MEIDFELVLEGISLGIDVFVLGILYKSYESCSAYIEALKVTRCSKFLTQILFLNCGMKSFFECIKLINDSIVLIDLCDLM